MLAVKSKENSSASKLRRGRKKLEWLLDATLVKDKRIVVTRDTYNWIVLNGSAKSENFFETADRWFFSSIESMLRHLFQVHLKFAISEIEFNSIMKALKEAEARVSELGSELDGKIGVEKGDKNG